MSLTKLCERYGTSRKTGYKWLGRYANFSDYAYSGFERVAVESTPLDCRWIAEKLVVAFSEADRLCRERYQYPKRFSFPTAVLLREEEEKRFGKNPWSHGLSSNAHVLEKFVEYAEQQGYISSRPSLSELFAMPGSTSSSPRSEAPQRGGESRMDTPR